MSEETELTPQNAGELLFGRPNPESEGEQTTVAEEAAAAAQQGEADSELTADQLELADRYGLTAQEVRRVRGKTWDEKCQDAQRSAEVVKQQPNRGEIAALSAHKTKQNRALVELLHGRPSQTEDGKES